MSRSGYVDDCENIDLYRATVARALKGQRGQAFLMEMADAMDAMPEKVLIAGELVDPDGQCCAIGSVCLARGMTEDDLFRIDYEDPDLVGSSMGISRSMAAEIEYMNDEWSPRESPERRWKRMREWIDQNLLTENRIATT